MTAVYEIDAPQKRSFAKFVAMLVAGATGVGAALITDFVQKGDASALIIMNSIVNNSLNLNVPLLYQAVAFLAAGAIAVFMFEPRNVRSAFYMGASILAVLMTSMPVDEPEDLVTVVEELRPLFEQDGVLYEQPMPGMLPQDPDGSATESSVIDAPEPAAPVEPSGQGNGAADTQDGAWLDRPADDASARVIRAGMFPSLDAVMADGVVSAPHSFVIPVQDVQRIPLILNVRIPNATSLPDRISVRLHDANSGRTWDLTSLSRATRDGNGYLLRAATAIPPAVKGNSLADLYVRVEIPGYEIADLAGRKVTSSEAVELEIAMNPSSTPLILQRLNRPYRFQ